MISAAEALAESKRNQASIIEQRKKHIENAVLSIMAIGDTWAYVGFNVEEFKEISDMLTELGFSYEIEGHDSTYISWSDED